MNKRTLIAMTMAGLMTVSPMLHAEDVDKRKGAAGGIGGAQRAAQEVYAGSLFTQIAIGVGVLAIIGVLVAGSSDNGQTTTQTTP